ncbi:MAG: PD-(D/E)XK nuclease family transposase [Thiocapsa sp.]|uniref:PD-(D/E)XK nuclease family transposase n=2 Tax=Thiocapsa sp. TaxID=2024551 RepID=UPI001BCB275E|nr:PD-(D/E)XK nuclease family transposase [Thiocapsa sp.]QVL49801.1 MAG: PD-(D/E)XK nuclease family transposase [Thiocapsa sp.]
MRRRQEAQHPPPVRWASHDSRPETDARPRVETDAERWLKFLKDGEHLNPEHLPEWMQHPIMRQAMSILSRFSEKERDYHRYQSRQEALRVQRTIQRVLDEARAATEAERQAKEAERQAKEAARAGEQAAREGEQAALAEVARLKALLEQQKDG